MNNAHDDSAIALADFDLNLLVAFDALARELSVTRAAQRLSVSQSAMSHTLRRLRDLMGDPLLVRGKGGMILTPRAAELVIPVRTGLYTLQAAVSLPGTFEPSTSQRSFRLATPDLFNALAIPTLLERIRTEATGVDISLLPTGVGGPQLLHQLETGEMDVAVIPWMDGGTGEPSQTAPGLIRRLLFRDTFASYLRIDHPCLATCTTVSLSTFTRLSHALVSQSGTGLGIVDQALAKQGRNRRIALRITDFYSALAIVSRSDLILTAPAALKRLMPSNVVCLPPPLPLPGHTVNLLWHERFSRDPGHIWFRDAVASAAMGSQQR